MTAFFGHMCNFYSGSGGMRHTLLKVKNILWSC